jgi:UDP-2-acetamido-3-amino-2,3-dideoxy-glucuronate N-acetyltransferase
MNTQLLDLNGIVDERGTLVALESLKNVPFEIKRVYYLTKMKSDLPRGFHAHKELKQLVVCLSGSCDFIIDNGKERKTVKLNDPTKGLIVESMIWREMHNFSSDCVLIVLASEYFSEDDYIRDYETFKKGALK